ncbi:MAG: toxin-antitoxin system HicB family antitoxin [Clostridia bacterium]|nr:toxin-antitoxin system HicB family antitoxin [Clostridia bacterium]
MTKKDLDYYLTLPYRVVLYPAVEGGYVVEMPDLPGCLSQGETVEEAYTMIRDAQKLWLKTALELGREIPEPADDEYSGKFNVRVPKSLHKALSEKAKAENISLNQLILYHLARGIGHNG